MFSYMFICDFLLIALRFLFRDPSKIVKASSSSLFLNSINFFFTMTHIWIVCVTRRIIFRYIYVKYTIVSSRITTISIFQTQLLMNAQNYEVSFHIFHLRNIFQVSQALLIKFSPTCSSPSYCDFAFIGWSGIIKFQFFVENATLRTLI